MYEGFKKLIIELNSAIEQKIPTNIDFYFTISKSSLNLIDFTEGIPFLLRGSGLGYKLYKLIIRRFDYITTNKYSTFLAYNIWYKMMTDDELYFYTSNFSSGVISKQITNEKLKTILNQIRNMGLIFDTELTEKIIELYGSMDTHTQGNT